MVNLYTDTPSLLSFILHTRYCNIDSLPHWNIPIISPSPRLAVLLPLACLPGDPQALGRLLLRHQRRHHRCEGPRAARWLAVRHRGASQPTPQGEGGGAKMWSLGWAEWRGTIEGRQGFSWKADAVWNRYSQLSLLVFLFPFDVLPGFGLALDHWSPDHHGPQRLRPLRAALGREWQGGALFARGGHWDC